MVYFVSKFHPLNSENKATGASGHFIAPAPAEKGGVGAFLIDFCAGGVAGAVAKTATAPIERVKLLIQTQDANPKIISGEVPRYTGIVNCFTRVSSEQGFSAFWRGNTVNVIRYFPTQAFNFAFKDTIKALFPKYNSKTEFWKFFAANMASGGLAGAGSLTIVYPLDYARTRLASDVGSGNPQFSGLGDCLMKTINSGGFFSMYAGFGVSVVGIVAYRGPYFGVFDTLKALNPYKKDKGIIGLASKFAIAQFTAIIAGFISYPFDTVRRRLQMQAEKPKDQWLYSGTLDCALKIVKDEGIGAMFKGFAANVLRTLGGALVLVGYDEIKAMIGS
jgi:solute carrier family 25 (adenine nucleotide translocator) protein 4/5/6/31